MTPGEAAYPAEWELDALLADGASVHLRPIRPSDAPGLVQFHAGLSEDTVHRRFFAHHPELSEAEAERFTSIDYDRRFALVATLEDRLVAVARYDVSRPGRAEVAFVVADAEQGRGIGSLLLEQLAAAARERGIGHFEAETQVGNSAMLGVFRDAGFELSTSVSDGFVHVEFPVAATAASLVAADERERQAEVASLRRLLHPATVAVVGASRRPGTIGHELFRNLIRSGFGGAAYPVNPQARSVAGVRAYSSVRQVPEPVDLAIVVVPAAVATAVVEECGEVGVKSVVVVSAGYAETGQEGAARQAELSASARRYGMRLVGPNCLGVVNTAPDVSMDATFAPTEPLPGPVGFLSQSGALGIAVLERAAEIGLGLSSFVSVGNKADVSGNDLLCYWEADPRTTIVLLYLESFGNPRKFARIARRVSRSKPIVALKSGRTSLGARAARSHTAAAATPDAATEALFRQAGVIRVSTMAEMFDVALVLQNQPVPVGNRVAIVGNSGGPGILAADACGEAELTIGEIGPETVAALSRFLPAEASLANPVDLVAGASASHFERALDAVLSDGGVDAVVAIFTPPLVTKTEEVAAAVNAASERRPGKPVIASVLGGNSSPGLLSSDGRPGRVPVFPFPEQAVRALGHAARYGRWLSRPAGSSWVIDGADAERARSVARELLRGAPAEGCWLAEGEAARLLGTVGVQLTAARHVDDAGDAVRAAGELGFPVVLKAASPEIVHKTDVGAVALGLGSAEEVESAFSAMRERLGGAMGGALLQAMVPSGVETIVGVTQDAAFGPLIAFGLGGISTEVLGDISFRILPLTDADADELVRSVRAAPLLLGHRGQPPADLAALEDLLMRVATLADTVPELSELDLNPVIVRSDGLSVVDAKVHLKEAPPGPDPLARVLARGVSTGRTAPEPT